MRVLLVLLVAAMAVVVGRRDPRGTKAPIASYGFMVSLRLAETPDDHRCGGTLVEPDIVLAAAHCVARLPAGGVVAVVGADTPDWPKAPPVETLGHRIPDTFTFRVDNRDDSALVRLATRQTGPTVPLATSEPRVGTKVVTAGWGCTNAPPVCEVEAAALQASGQTVLRDAACGRVVLWTRPTYAARTNICTRGTRARSTINRGDSGGPLLVRDRSGAFRQLGVTASARTARRSSTPASPRCRSSGAGSRTRSGRSAAPRRASPRAPSARSGRPPPLQGAPRRGGLAPARRAGAASPPRPARSRDFAA